jgi:hypothetical protein
MEATVTDKNLLITFGCSWTYGVGVNYSPGMNLSTFKENVWNTSLCDKLSFRGILSSNLGLDNINFSQGGSSNQRQFRLAKKFFVSAELSKLKKKYKNIIVLWGITSTARNEMFDLNQKELVNFFLDDDSPSIAKQLVKYSYDHDNEVRQLALDMKFWNLFFEQSNIDNFWFDTFNHHDYNQTTADLDSQSKKYYDVIKGANWPSWEKFIIGDLKLIPLSVVKEIYRIPIFGNFLKNCHPRYNKINRLIGNDTNRDIASQLTIKHNWKIKQDNYHRSLWNTVDSERIVYLTNLGLLNPWSKHPTKECHQEIAQIFEPYIVDVLNKK